MEFNLPDYFFCLLDFKLALDPGPFQYGWSVVQIHITGRVSDLE